MVTIKEQKQVATEERGSKIGAPMTASLFPSVVITVPAPKEGKKGKRTTLGKLFQSECEETTVEEKAGKDEDCAGVQWLKRTPALLRTPPSASTRSVGITTGRFSDAGPASGQTKLHKIVHMFNRKVHPLSLASVKPAATSKSHRQMNKMPSPIRCREEEEEDKTQLRPDSYNVTAMASPDAGATKEECSRSCHCQTTQPAVLGGSYSKANREHWIRTDAEYLVLEL